MTISITDHALLRYLERIHGIDLEAVREEMRAEVAEAVARGMVYYQAGDGIIYALTGNVVKTVIVRDPAG